MTQGEALAVTLAVEAPIVIAMGWRVVDDRVRLLALSVAASLCTHPFAWWANQALIEWPFFTVRAPVIELSVIVAEAALFRLALFSSWRRAGATSLAANAASFTLGLLVYYAS